jgi:hypothetical protein
VVQLGLVAVPKGRLRLGTRKAEIFTLEAIIAVNRSWKDEADPPYLGKADASHYPGDIDPKRFANSR